MLTLGRSNGRYPRMLRALSRAKLLIIDDWGPETLRADRCRDLLEIVEDRYDRGSILITSQTLVDRWYESSEIQRWPTRSWIAWFTTPTASISPARAFTNDALPYSTLDLNAVSRDLTLRAV